MNAQLGPEVSADFNPESIRTTQDGGAAAANPATRESGTPEGGAASKDPSMKASYLTNPSGGLGGPIAQREATTSNGGKNDEGNSGRDENDNKDPAGQRRSIISSIR